MIKIKIPGKIISQTIVKGRSGVLYIREGKIYFKPFGYYLRIKNAIFGRNIFSKKYKKVTNRYKLTKNTMDGIIRKRKITVIDISRPKKTFII